MNKNKKNENYLHALKQIPYDMGHLTIARCLLAEEGPSPKKNKKKLVLKCVLVKI